MIMMAIVGYVGALFPVTQNDQKNDL
jgi:hypothetical protein